MVQSELELKSNVSPEAIYQDLDREIPGSFLNCGESWFWCAKGGRCGEITRWWLSEVELSDSAQCESFFISNKCLTFQEALTIFANGFIWPFLIW